MTNNQWSIGNETRKHQWSISNYQWPIGNKTQEKLNEKSKEFIPHLLIIDHWSLTIDH